MTNPADSNIPGGLFDSLRELCAEILGSAGDRIRLLSLELSEEKIRFVRTLVLTAWAVFSGFMTAGCVTLAVILLCDAPSRGAVTIGFAGLYGAATAAFTFALRRRLRRMPRPFSDTMEELAADARCLRPRI